MNRKKPFYHLTDVSCVRPILRRGLRGGVTPRNRGGDPLSTPSIFVLTADDEALTDHVAINQLWPFQDIGEYAVIEIQLAGITGKVRFDKVAERSAGFHRIIEQDVIEPTHLKLAKTRRLDFPGRKLLEIAQAAYQRKWSEEEWQIARTWCDGTVLRIQEQFLKQKAKRKK